MGGSAPEGPALHQRARWPVVARRRMEAGGKRPDLFRDNHRAERADRQLPSPHAGDPRPQRCLTMARAQLRPERTHGFLSVFPLEPDARAQGQQGGERRKKRRFLHSPGMSSPESDLKEVMIHMVNVNESHHSIVNLRGMLVALVVAYASTLYVEWHPHQLSTEATQYQQLAYLTMSGFSIKFMLQKLSWIIGNGFGVLGLILMFIRSQRGTLFLFMCPLLLGAAALFGAAEPAYPNVESTTALLLWCTTSAIWGCVVVYALLLRDQLFPRRQMPSPP